MATTRIIPMHQNKGKTIRQCLSDRLDYGKNPDKTHDGQLISAYACDPETADAEFALSKREYYQLTGRRQDSDVIAYQVRQSFRPGEITPEEANRIGYEFAERFLKGNHAFIVCTHTDKQHIQNQITKQQARALLYYQQHGFTSADDFEAFAESVEAVKQRRDALSAQITSAEKRLNEIAVLQKHITNYLKTKDIYAGYRASGYSKAYYEEHEDEIKLCKASKRAFDELLPSDTSGKTAGSHKKQLPSLKALRAEYAELLAMKKAAYPEYYRAKDEYRELLTYQANLARLFGIENVRSAPQREHQQEEK